MYSWVNLSPWETRYSIVSVSICVCVCVSVSTCTHLHVYFKDLTYWIFFLYEELLTFVVTQGLIGSLPQFLSVYGCLFVLFVGNFPRFRVLGWWCLVGFPFLFLGILFRSLSSHFHDFQGVGGDFYPGLCKSRVFSLRLLLLQCSLSLILCSIAGKWCAHT